MPVSSSAEDDAAGPERAMPATRAEGSSETLLRGAVRDADAAVALAGPRPADQEAAAPRGRVRLRAGVRRLVRRRGARGDPQHQPRVGGDLRRLPLRILARRAAAQEPPVLQAVRRAEGPRGGRRRRDAGEGREALPPRARHHPARRQEARRDDLRIRRPRASAASSTKSRSRSRSTSRSSPAWPSAT